MVGPYKKRVLKTALQAVSRSHYNDCDRMKFCQSYLLPIQHLQACVNKREIKMPCTTLNVELHPKCMRDVEHQTYLLPTNAESWCWRMNDIEQKRGQSSGAQNWLGRPRKVRGTVAELVKSYTPSSSCLFSLLSRHHSRPLVFSQNSFIFPILIFNITFPCN